MYHLRKNVKLGPWYKYETHPSFSSELQSILKELSAPSVRVHAESRPLSRQSKIVPKNMAVALTPQAAEGQDARIHPEVDHPLTRPQQRKPHDPSVTFEEYHHWALLTRAEEDALSKNDIGDTTFFRLILPSKSNKGDVVHTIPPENGEKLGPDEKAPRDVHDMEHGNRHDVSDDEWQNASRALRTATWAAVFYLITTDILGPFNVP